MLTRLGECNALPFYTRHHFCIHRQRKLSCTSGTLRSRDRIPLGVLQCLCSRKRHCDWCLPLNVYTNFRNPEDEWLWADFVRSAMNERSLLTSGPIDDLRTSVHECQFALSCKYRSGGPGYYKKKKVVGLERGPLSLVSTLEELLGRNSNGSGLERRECGRRDSSR
jgi:hypothetical protein